MNSTNTSTPRHSFVPQKCTTKANIKNCPWATHGDMIRVRCPYTGVWIIKESEWVTLS